ncbi:MAG: LPS export ABC transporter periplasmic protein LptC [Calothrix sp. C42_A2020_038]|nr:LPS export ABC transporter periplasmic protein LptC [Calothrix sp. C42_A2020_038]
MLAFWQNVVINRDVVPRCCSYISGKSREAKMFEKYGFNNFAWLRRLHLSFLLPGVLTYVVLLHATANSIYAQTLENQAPTVNTIQTPANQAVSINVIVEPATVLTRHDVITWLGDVEFRCELQKITATAEKAEYYQSEQKVVLTGKVKIIQTGQSHEAETATFFVNEFKITGDKVNMPNY